MAGASHRLWADNIDGRRVECILDVRSVELLNHFDASAAVFGDLIDVSAFHQAHTDVRVAKTVGSAPIAVAI
jgi:hypothetical protein